MKSNKWFFIFLLVFLAITFVAWEFFVTSRMLLNIQVIYPQGMSEDVGFEMRIYSDGFEREMIVYPEDEAIEFSSLPFGDYFFELTLDDRLMVKEFHSFSSQFSISRLKETVAFDISELASITSVDYKIVDPYLTVKWNGKYLGGYRPSEYLIRMNGRESILNVNYVEVDVLKELLKDRETIELEIIPLTLSGGELLAYKIQVPIRLESVYLDIPEGFNIYDMSMNIQEKRIPIDPYDPEINFPVIDLSENKIPFEIYYYEDKIWKSHIKLSEMNDRIKIPEIPEATLTQVQLNESTVTLVLDVSKEEEFLYNRFSHFEILSDSLLATTTKEYTYKNDNQTLDITPFFSPDIKGKTLSFKIPSPPYPLIHTTMYDENMTFSPSIKVFSKSSLPLNGTLTIDNTEKRILQEFTESTMIEVDFERDEVHLIEVILEDIYGQQAQQSKWVSTAVPETTFFSECDLNPNQILSVAWDQLTIYPEVELIVTDNYNVKRFYPEGSALETDLSGTLLREPLKVILKGFLNDEEYTAAVIEEIRCE